MKPFASLLFGLDDPGSRQRAARAQLPSMLARSNFRHWSLSMPTPLDSDRILLGIAVWSRYDLELLDRLDAGLAKRQHAPVIYVFDVDECQSTADFERYMPGLGTVYHPPVVAIWQKGVLTARASGFAGRKLLAQSGLLE